MKSISIVLLFVISIFAKDTLKMVLGAEWFPYNYTTESKELVGADVSIAEQIISQTGKSVSITELPFARGLLYLEEGKSDFMVGTSKTNEREAYAYFSVPYREEVISMMFKKGEAAMYQFSSLADLKKYKLIAGIEPQGWYGQELEDLKEDPEMKPFLQTHTMLYQRLNLLMHDRFDCVIDDKYALLATAEKLGITDSVEIHTYNLVEDSVHFMFSKKMVDSAFVSQVSEIIRTAQQDGTIENILRSYPLK